MQKKKSTYIFLVMTCLLVSACGTIEPWEKGNLARYEMNFSPDILEKQLNDHIYFSKEASSSGHSISGGGCGCN